MQWKKNSSLPEECGDKKFSMLPGRSPQFLQIFTAKFNAYHKFTGNIIEVSDRWRSGVKSCWQSCRRWKVRTRVRQFIFVRNPVNARNNIFSTKNHKTYKMSPHSTLKDAGGEKVFVSRLFAANHTFLFLPNLNPKQWPLIRPRPTHTARSQTKFTGSGISFERTIIWSEVISGW